MSRKVTVQNFEDFIGEDVTSSPLRTDPKSAVRMQNVEKTFNGSLRGRQGYKVCSQRLSIQQMFTYQYDNDGVVTKEILALAFIGNRLNTNNVQLFRLKSHTFPVERTASLTNWGVSILPDTANDRYLFKIFESGVEVFSKSLGNGLESLPVTLKDLADDIDALSDYSCFPDKTAIVDGAQTAKAITVLSGHTIDVGDIVQVNTPFNALEVYQTDVSVSAATTVTFTTENNIVFADADIIGHGNFPAATLDLLVLSEDANATKNLTYWYLEQIPFLPAEHTNTSFIAGPFFTSYTTRADLKHTKPSLVNHRNCVYMTGKDVVEKEYDQFIDQTPVGKVYAGVYKYDGYRVRLAHTPREDLIFKLSLLQLGTTAAPLAAGTYNYKFSITVCDCQQNQVEHFTQFEDSLTANGTNDVQVSYPILAYSSLTHRDPRPYAIISSTLTAGATTTNTFTITSGHKLRVGDYIYFTETGNTETTLRRITAFTNTSVTIDGDAVTVANGSIISTGRIRIWRTTADTKTYYLAYDYPLEVTTATISRTLVDSKADSALGIRLTAVAPEYEQFPLPPATAISTIEDVLVVGGGKRSAQTVHWENPVTPEFSPRATSNYMLPTKASGDIKAFIENVFSGLLINKNKALYTSGGNFSDNSVELKKESENGYGANNPSGVTEANQIIVGVNDLGLWTNDRGQISDSFGSNYRKYFSQCSYTDTTRLRANFARVFYDDIKNWIHVFIPAFNTTTFVTAQLEANSNSKHLVYMIDSGCWVEFKYNDYEMYPSGGFATDDDTLYQGGAFISTDHVGYVFKRLDQHTTNPAYDYHDNGSTFDYDILTAWDDDGEPEHEKAWNELIIYSLQPDCFISSYTIKVESYRDWKETTAKRDTQRLSTFVFDSSSVYEKKCLFDKGYKAKRRAIRFYGTIDLNPPLISGYSYMLSPNQYGKDRAD